jgi:aspartate/methionine/tyrosine aminotransferase
VDIKPFETERFFARHEFTAPYVLCASDCEPLIVDELLEMAGVGREVLGRLRLGYTETQGAPSLRARIAGLYAGARAEHVVVLGAPEEGIFLLMHALLEAGDEVVVLTPCYDSLANVAEYLRCRVVRWPLVEAEEQPGQTADWQLDLDRLKALVTPRTRLLVVNFPHNPTGYVPSAEQWREIVDLAERTGVWLFSDEMYRGLEYEAGQRLPAACDLSDRAVTLSGLSKTYGLPGLRMGWLVVADEALRARVLRWKDYTTICASAPSEVLAETALQVAERLADRSRAIVSGNLRTADAFFARRPALFRWNRPLAGSVALVGLRRGSAGAFCDRLLREAGVLLLPGTCLGSDDRHVRFGLGRRRFAEALVQLDRWLGESL